MKEIFQEYGSVLITLVAILSIIIVVAALIGGANDGPIHQAFSTLIHHFMDQANSTIPSISIETPIQ